MMRQSLQLLGLLLLSWNSLNASGEPQQLSVTSVDAIVRHDYSRQDDEHEQFSRKLHVDNNEVVIATPQNPLQVLSRAFQAAAPPKGTPPLTTDCVKQLKGASLKQAKASKKKGPPPRLCREISSSSGSAGSRPLPPPPPPPDNNEGKTDGTGGGGTDGTSVPEVNADDDDSTLIGRGEPTISPGLQGDGTPAPTAASSYTTPPVMAPSMTTPTMTTPFPTPSVFETSTVAPTAGRAEAEATFAPSKEPTTRTGRPSASPTSRPTATPKTACDKVADETFVSSSASSSSTTFDLQLGLAVSSTASVEQVLDELRLALQTQVAPTLTNCSDAASDENSDRNNSNGRRRLRYLQNTDSQEEATIVNVVFGSLQVDEFNECSEFGIASDGKTVCVTTRSRVTAYYDNSVGNLSGFPNSLETAIMSANLDVQGNDVVSSLATKSVYGTPPVQEGGGDSSNDDDLDNNDDASGRDDDTNDDDGTSGIQGPSNVEPGAGGISAGAAVAVTLSVLVVVLASVFAANRRGRRFREDNSLLKAANTDDEEDESMLHSSSAYSSTPYQQKRMAHVVGEDDSILTSDYSNNGDGVEVQPVYAASRVKNNNRLDRTFDEDFMNEDENIEVDSQDRIQHADHHWCSSPHCESCELKRQRGVTFIPTNPQRASDIPRNARRTYNLHDTVDL
ncbi:hypothetical protein MPSEU_001103700 [Mayamaea pseudoterrestris]|nr:hypothetical protein MPSEU_001103700 [Mayamaea pseudoterrestris]